MKKYIRLVVATAIISAVLLTAAFALTPGTKAPDFTIPGLDGKNVALSDLNGKVVLMDVWATWCGPCRGEIPYLVGLSKKLNKDEAMVLGVAIDTQKELVSSFAKEQKIGYKIALDPGGTKLGPAYGVRGIPATFIIDKKGAVRYMYTGFPSKPDDQKKEIAEMEQHIKELVAEK